MKTETNYSEALNRINETEEQAKAAAAVVAFAFDGRGNFEWETDRDFVSY